MNKIDWRYKLKKRLIDFESGKIGIDDIEIFIANLIDRSESEVNVEAGISDDFCKWIYDEDDDTFFTACDNGFTITNGSLEDNHFRYCIYCGKRIKIKKSSKNSR